MSLIDSEAAFQVRVAECMLSDRLAKFKSNGITTLAEVATASAYVPGGDEKLFIEGLVVPILGDEKHVAKGRLRRLFLVAYTLFTEDLARTTSRRSEDQPRVLPPEERAARLANLKAKVPGIVIDGELAPSHRSLDLAYELADTNAVRYLDLKDMTTRSAELRGVKVETLFRKDDRGFLKETSEARPDPARLDDHLMFRQALTRRSLALEVAGVCSFTVHELWASALLAAVQRDAAPGFTRVTPGDHGPVPRC